MGNNIGLYISFFAYFVIVLAIGAYFYRRSKQGVSSYFLGDRQMNPWVTALSAQSSDMSAWLFMSLPAAAYLFGYQAAWIAIGLALGTWVNWKVVAPRLRNFSQAFDDAITVPEYLGHRFKSTSPVLQLICSAVIIMFFMLYVASGFSAQAKLFQEIFDAGYHTALFIGAFVILFYTFLGGFHAVSWTDFFQAILMFFALLLVPIIVYGKLSGDAVSTIFSGDFMQGTFFSSQNGSVAGEIVSGLGWGLGYFGMPHILVRFMAIRSASEIKRSRRIALVWVYLTLAAAIAIGVFGAKYLASQGIVYGSQIEAERVFMKLSAVLFPPWLAGILLSAILAAIMSTVSAQLLVVGSAMINDIYLLFRRNDRNDRHSMMLSRASIVVVTMVAIVIAWRPDNTIMGFVSYAVAGFGATFGPALVLSLLWKRLTLKGTLAGMVVGALGVIVWESLDLYTVTNYYSIVPAFVLSWAVTMIVSLADKKPSEEIVDCFEKASKMKI